jgi:hypothetical protein
MCLLAWALMILVSFFCRLIRCWPMTVAICATLLLNTPCFTSPDFTTTPNHHSSHITLSDRCVSDRYARRLCSVLFFGWLDGSKSQLATPRLLRCSSNAEPTVIAIEYPCQRCPAPTPTLQPCRLPSRLTFLVWTRPFGKTPGLALQWTGRVTFDIIDIAVIRADFGDLSIKQVR